LAVAVAELAEGLPDALAPLDQALGGMLRRAVDSRDFRGKRDETLLLYPDGIGASRLLLVGLGERGAVARDVLRRGAAIAARRAASLGAPSLTLAVEHASRSALTGSDVGQVLVEGAAHGAWLCNEYRSPDDERSTPPAEAVVALADSDADAGRALGEAVATGQSAARELQARPGNVCTPSFLAEHAQSLGETHGFDVTVFDRAAIEREGFRALLAVSQGSAQEPRFIELSYRGAGDAAPVVLVGKGITFDSGGISLKPPPSMEEMKYDMSGAAAVLGTFEALGRLAPPINVVGLVPSAENLPSSTALKPGDVVRSHFGKTIEIVNTDAEGRLILADALSYARRHAPSCVLDAATLTGAVVIALGPHAIGLMGNDDALLDEVRGAGERAGERCWPLPLWDDYRELNKSDIADVKNSGGRPAGTISAGWFLREFVEGFPWAHLDIAGTAYTDRDRPASPKGPTGIGVRLFTEFLLARARA
jgi:leucyl aminopeptidase